MSLIQSGPNNRVDQSGVSADGDVVGRDKVIHETHHHHAARTGVIHELVKKLEVEIAHDAKIKHTIDTLSYYYTRQARGGVAGLEAKLKAGGRENELMDALAKKELFAKLLEKWSLYASAQQILAYLLGLAEHEFNSIIHPQTATLDKVAINQLTSDRIVAPIVDQCGSTVFAVNHSVAMGMVYWLAEQCYVRWHQ